MQKGGDYVGISRLEQGMWLLTDILAGIGRRVGGSLYKLTTLIMLVIFVLYLALVWFPLDILFQGLNRPRRY